MFILSQILGIYAGLFILEDEKNNEIVKALALVSRPNEPVSVFYIFFCILLGALIFYLLIKFYKGNLVFMLLEFSVISFASSIIFYSFIKPLIYETYFSMILSIFLALVFGLLKILVPELKNLAAIIGTAGAGAVFGFSLTFYTALILLVLLCVYDFIAVFKTKHMVAMAQELSKREMAFMITSKEKTEKGEIFFELGSGDMLMPIVLSVSVFQLNPLYTPIIFFSSVFALFVLFILLTKQRTILPALPIIAVCNFVFLGIAKLFGI